jgi:hypothetical protein
MIRSTYGILIVTRSAQPSLPPGHLNLNCNQFAFKTEVTLPRTLEDSHFYFRFPVCLPDTILHAQLQAREDTFLLVDSERQDDTATPSP